MGEKIIYHKEIDADNSKWLNLSFATQMANIGSEISRACIWKSKGNDEKMII